MKLKALITAGIADLTLIVGAGLQAQSASATTPPGNDHAFTVTLSSTTAGAHPDIGVNLTLCTNGNGIGGTANECTASAPAQPFFDQATANFKGLQVNGAQPIPRAPGPNPVRHRDERRRDPGRGLDQGQAAPCGAVTHLTPPAFDLWAGAKTGATVCHGPLGTPRVLVRPARRRGPG